VSKIVGVEAAGHGHRAGTRNHAASLAGGAPGMLHGNKTYLLQDEDGQITEGHSISAGLDYPGIGPEHAGCTRSAASRYTSVTDDEALEHSSCCAAPKGIIPALESATPLRRDQETRTDRWQGPDHLVNLCGRGDKDIFTVAKALGVEI
jgi:tryptophan synthase beta chain